MAKLKSGTRVYGNIQIDGGVYDSSSQIGIGGSYLMSTGVGIAWTTLSSPTISITATDSATQRFTLDFNETTDSLDFNYTP
jgi:hypothetical protein